MHDIEPHYLWRELYLATNDRRSPFYGYHNSEVYFTDSIYDHLIHPQWDFFGAETLYMKQLFTDYVEGFTVLEFFGEWNDVLHNDIMFLKRDILEPIMAHGINKFILIGENLLNFHEWFEELEDGWITLINFRQHVLTEIKQFQLDHFLFIGGELNDLPWHSWSPHKLFREVNNLVSRRIGY